MSPKPKLHSVDASLDAEGRRHGARAIVLKPLLKIGAEHIFRSAEYMLAEAVGLAEAIQLKVVKAEHFNLHNPVPATLLGRGQVEKWGRFIAEEKIHLAIIDHPLSPVQQRNLERAWNCKVIDRTGLILEIFGERARTKEGQLQVELAALTYQKSRLVRSWTHLERQRGGFGFLGGPGESQLEIDRRIITNRIARLKEELKEVRRTRCLQRQKRRKSEHSVIALVGYTNAGKSTLFNRLTGAEVEAEDKLFATLDPTMRGITLPSGRKVIVSDTVGFISELPTHLVEAFRATLEEVQNADLILHIRDISHPETRAQKKAVEMVLADLGIDRDDSRLIEVLNKADLLPEEERRILRERAMLAVSDSRRSLSLSDVAGTSPSGGMVLVSALTGDGMQDLLRLIDERLALRFETYEIEIPLAGGAAISWLYENGEVITRKEKKEKVSVKVTLSQADFGRFINKFGKEVNVKYKN